MECIGQWLHSVFTVWPNFVAGQCHSISCMLGYAIAIIKVDLIALIFFVSLLLLWVWVGEGFVCACGCVCVCVCGVRGRVFHIKMRCECIDCVDIETCCWLSFWIRLGKKKQTNKQTNKQTKKKRSKEWKKEGQQENKSKQCSKEERKEYYGVCQDEAVRREARLKRLTLSWRPEFEHGDVDLNQVVQIGVSGWITLKGYDLSLDGISVLDSSLMVWIWAWRLRI